MWFQNISFYTDIKNELTFNETAIKKDTVKNF